jgi:DNA repair photolyase
MPTAVMASRMIPTLNDAELEAIMKAGARAGATAASTILVRLPL